MALADQVQAAIEVFLNTKFTVTTSTAFLDGGVKDLLIEQAPLASIVSIYNVDASATVTSTSYGFYTSGRIYKHDGSLWGADGNNEQFTVTFTYGYSSVPDDIQLAIDTWVAYLTADSTASLKSYKTGDDSETYADIGEMPPMVHRLLTNRRRRILL